MSSNIIIKPIVVSNESAFVFKGKVVKYNNVGIEKGSEVVYNINDIITKTTQLYNGQGLDKDVIVHILPFDKIISIKHTSELCDDVYKKVDDFISNVDDMFSN